MDDTTRSIRQALKRDRSQKQASALALATRTGELDERLRGILQSAAELLALKARLTPSWTG